MEDHLNYLKNSSDKISIPSDAKTRSNPKTYNSVLKNVASDSSSVLLIKYKHTI